MPLSTRFSSSSSSRYSTVTLLAAATAIAASTASTGCGTLSPPFDKMKDSQMTVYRLQNFEPPIAAQGQPAATAGFQLPPQIQQWITAGASLLPPGLLPPGLLPGSAAATAPAAADTARFHGFRILEWQPVNDASIKSDITDVFGHSSSFQPPGSNCMYAEFGFALAQADGPTPADVLVSLSCEQVQSFNFAWPYSNTGVTPNASTKFASIAKRVFQGR